MRLACTVEYEGTMYHGFQNQTNLPTVQGHIDKALEHYKTIKEASKALGITSRSLHLHIANKKKAK